MAAKLISLRNVLEEEADGIRELLTRYHIDFYETPPNHWGISAPIIWINDEDQLETAKALLEDYQKKLTERVRAEYEQHKQEGQHHTFTKELSQHPVRVIAFLAIVAAITYVSVVPFIKIGQ